jgi:hypothetical protein
LSKAFNTGVDVLQCETCLPVPARVKPLKARVNPPKHLIDKGKIDSGLPGIVF